MGWLSGFYKKQLEPSWEYSADSVLWRLIPSSDRYLAGEDRNVEEKTVSFFCIDRRTGAVYWKGLRFGEPWWMGIEEIHRDVILFHGYATPDMPDHKAITAVDCPSGRILWTNRDLKFLFASGGRVYGVRDEYESRKFFVIDLADGSVLGEPDGEEVARVRSESDRGLPAMVLPEAIGGSSAPEAVRRALGRLKLGEEPASADALSDAGSAFVVSCHARSGGTAEAPMYRQEFVVVGKRDGRILYRDLVAGSAAAVVPETFFSIGGMFYYVRERRTLKAVNLLSGEEAHGKDQNQAR